MKRIATHIILILTVMLSAVQVRSQSYPVQTNLYVMAPYSQTYSDYYADGQQRMYVNVLLNDMSQGQLDVVLRFSIKGNNLKLTTNPASPVKPITIQSGRLYRVEGSELAKFLKADQMIAEGRMADEFRKSGRLPEGYYEVKVEVVEYYRKARVSAPAYSTVWIMQPEPPVWTMPQKNSKLEATNPQFVLFGWMMTGNTTMLQNLSYTFSIYEKPANVNADVVVKSATPIYSEEMKQSTLVYGPDKPLLELGKTYACRIKVVDAEGLVSFKNDGYSDVLVFRYGEECLPPSHISITDVSKNGATVNWVGSDSHYGYDIEVREITEGKSSEWYVWNIDKKQCNYDVKQLSPGSKYECRMRAVCGQRSKGIKSPYSETSEFETYAAGNKKYNCGELVQANKYEDRDPHPWLEEGDIIEANGFLFTIESVSKASERVFSGQCSWYIDLWGVSILCDFIDIQVNKHLQLISGKIVACRDKLKAKAFTRLQSTAYQPVGAQVPNTFKPEKVVAVEETVDSIRIVDSQTLIYVAGKEPTKIAATDNVFVKSADGNYYAVADGKVYPKPSNLNSDTGDIELSYTEKITAMFGYDDNMGAHPGVDAYSDEKKAFAAQYDHYQLHSDDAYATWMAKDGSRAAIAKMTVNGGDPSAVQVRSGGQTVTGFGGSDPNALYLPLITDGLYEAYYTTKDKKEKDVEVVAGQLNVVSYTQQSINVCLVGVNGTRYQNSISELAAYLNSVFGQAVTTINLTTASIEVDKFNGTLSAKESGALSAYNSDMKKLIRKVKKLPDYTDDTYYIMLVAKSDNPALGGFMPVNSNFGFVFAQANSGAGQMNRTIAHELGHGVFRLWHTFSSENLYTAQQGTTRNLMDYNGTNSELYKYQWDYIHNPQQGIVRWLVDDEEAEAIFETYYVDFTTDKFRDLHEIFKGKTEITYVTPGGRFITLPIAFKPNFTGTFVKSKNKEKVIPRVPDGVLFSFCDASGNYWGAHISVKDGNYYFLGYRKKNGDVYTDEYYTENLSSKLGMSAKVLLGLDPGCDLELYVTTCGVLKEAQTDNKGDDMVPDALAIEPLGEPVYAIHSHNKSCLGELGLKFYSEHAENVTDEDLLNKIFSVAKLIDKCGYNLYNDYKAFANNSNSNYWDKGVWPPEERYEILEKSLNAYTKGKDELEQLLKQYEDNENKFTIIAWMLVEKYYQSISVDTRYYILNKLSKNDMYGNALFGSGQEYLALKLIKTVPSEDSGKLVDLLKDDNTLENLYKKIDDQGGRDNFTTFILMLSELALHSDPLKVNVDNIYIWDDSFINQLLEDGNYIIGFQKDGNLHIDVYKTIYVEGLYTITKEFDVERSLKDVDPFTWIPIRYRGESQYLPNIGHPEGNVTYVPAIYLMALQTKKLTAVTIAAIKTSVDVFSLFFAVGEIKAAVTAAAKVISIIDAISSAVDIAITWSENDIIKLQGGEEFLNSYSVFSAILGAATFGADKIIKNNTKGVTDFLESWNSLCKNYSKDASSCEQLVEAIGKENFRKIEDCVNTAIESLKKEGVEIGAVDNIGELQSTIAKNAGIVDNDIIPFKQGEALSLHNGKYAITVANVRNGTNGKYAIIGRSMQPIETVAKDLEDLVGERNVVILDDRYLNGMKFHLDEYSFTPSEGEPIVFPAKDWSVSEAWNDMTNNEIYDKIRNEKGFIYNKTDLKEIPMYKINKQWIEKMKSDGYTIIDIGNPMDNNIQSEFYNMEKGIMEWE